MHRLGNLVYMPTLTASPSNAASSSSTLPPSAPNLTFNSSTDNPWGSLHVHVLPLFNGEPLRIPVEDLNILVKRHIQGVVAASPSRALATLETDASDLISSGMVTLNAKLSGIDDDKLVSRVVDLWGFFWDQVLPYVEGVLLPLQTDPVLSSLYHMPKSHRPSDNGHSSRSSLSSPLLSSAPQIDVRTVAIHAFRDQVILPIFSRLHVCLTMPTNQDSFLDKSTYQQPRLQQMLLVLVSQGRQRPVSLSLTAPDPQPSAGEAAIQHLLRAVHLPLTQLSLNSSPAMSKTTSSFLWGGQPRDRRGRIGQKPGHLKMTSIVAARKGRKGSANFGLEDDLNDGGETPTATMPNGAAGAGLTGIDFVDSEREREREFLDSLRSPDPEAHRGSIGGWGLGNWTEEGVKQAKGAEDEDEEMNWDQAQAVVERMVGMKLENGDSEAQRPEGRRKVT